MEYKDYLDERTVGIKQQVLDKAIANPHLDLAVINDIASMYIDDVIVRTDEGKFCWKSEIKKNSN